MNWFFNPCRHHRRSICLLASGLLPELEKAGIESHLAACADCRKYCEEIKILTVPLTNWPENFAHVQPDRAVQARWADAIQAAGRTKTSCRPPLTTVMREWWQDVIWPWRRVWAGLAVAWVLILAGNVSLREPSLSLAARTAPSEQQVMMSFKEQQKILAELLADRAAPREAEKRRPFLPQPRSECVEAMLT